MPNRTITDRISVTQLMSGAKTAEAKSTGIATDDASELEFICHVGVITNVANSPQPSWTLKLQDSDVDSDGSYAAADAADAYLPADAALGASGAFAVIDAAAEDDAIFRVGYRGGKEFARVVATPANTPGSTPIVIVAVKVKKRVA